MRLPLAAAAVLLAVAAPAARAEPVVALRLAVAPALGSAAEDVPMRSAVAALQFPVQVDALWRYRNLAGGLYGSWGYGRVDGCEGPCHGTLWRVGLQAIWTFREEHAVEPWVGISSGYEWAVAERDQGDAEVTRTWRGWELFGAQGGVEWHASRAVAVGPFVLVAAGRYTDLSVDTGLESGAAPIGRRAIHGWLHVGVRARLLLGGTR